jgi:hypothetical protein
MIPISRHRFPARAARRFALAAVSIAIHAFAANSIDAQPFSPAEAERFAERLDETGGTGDAARRAFARAWGSLDSLVLGRLNNGVEPAALNGLLAELPGYAAATEGEGFQLGRTAFYSRLPRETPRYFAAPVRIGGQTVVLGIYSLVHTAPGRLSVYTRTGGRWRRAGGFDGRAPIAAHLLPMEGGALGVVTVETSVGADHSAGYVKLWRLGADGLRLQRAVPGRLLDPDVIASDSAVVIEQDSVPPILNGAFLGPRLGLRTTYRARGGTIAAKVAETNPWLHAAERFYSLLDRRQRTAARALTADSAVFDALAARREVFVQEEGGDVDAGTGWVLLRAPDTMLRVESRRGADRRWRLTAVTREPLREG